MPKIINVRPIPPLLYSFYLYLHYIFFLHHNLLLPPSQGQKRWVGWKASQGQSSMRQHDGKAASAEEKGREGGSNLRHISSSDTSSKLSQYRAIICSNTGNQASCHKLLQAARL